MKLPRRTFLHLAAGAAALPALSRLAWAQTYPVRPVRMIVPFAPGGTTDLFARLAAQKLSEGLGKQFYVENIAGASGNVATGQVARAAPDGYTVLVAFSSHVVNPTLFDKIPYDPYKDFESVTPRCQRDYGALCQSLYLCEDGQGACRPHPRQSWKVQLRFARSRDACTSRGRTYAAIAQARPRACALQWCGAFGWISCCGTQSHRLHHHCGGRAVYQGRYTACARRHEQDTLSGTTGRADHD